MPAKQHAPDQNRSKARPPTPQLSGQRRGAGEQSLHPALSLQRSWSTSGVCATHQLLQLQHIVGNYEVGRLLAGTGQGRSPRNTDTRLKSELPENTMQAQTIQRLSEFQKGAGADFQTLIAQFRTAAMQRETQAAGILREIEQDPFTMLRWIPIESNNDHKGRTTLYVDDGKERKNLFLYNESTINQLPPGTKIEIEVEITFMGEQNSGKLAGGRTEEWYTVIHEFAAHLVHFWPLIKKLRTGKAQFGDNDKVAGGMYHPSTHHAQIPEHANPILTELISATMGYITTAILIGGQDWSIQPFIDAMEDDELKHVIYDTKKDLVLRIEHINKIIREVLPTVKLEDQPAFAQKLLPTIHESLDVAWKLYQTLCQLRTDTRSQRNIDLAVEGGTVAVPELPRRLWGPATREKLNAEIEMVDSRYKALYNIYGKIEQKAKEAIKKTEKVTTNN